MSGKRLYPDQQVVAIHNHYVRPGSRGYVAAIEVPYENGRTTNVVICMFGNRRMRMKPGELSDLPHTPRSFQ